MTTAGNKSAASRIVLHSKTSEALVCSIRLRSPDMHRDCVRAPVRVRVCVYAFTVALGSSLSPQRFSALTQQN